MATYGLTITNGMRSPCRRKLWKEGVKWQMHGWCCLSYSVNANDNKYKQVVCVLTKLPCHIVQFSFFSNTYILGFLFAILRCTKQPMTGKFIIFHWNESQRKIKEKCPHSACLSPLTYHTMHEIWNILISCIFFASCTPMTFEIFLFDIFSAKK